MCIRDSFETRPVNEGSAIRIGTPVPAALGLTTDRIPALADAMVAAMATPDHAEHDRIHREISRLTTG